MEIFNFEENHSGYWDQKASYNLSVFSRKNIIFFYRKTSVEFSRNNGFNKFKFSEEKYLKIL